jgi:ParB family chromosome partitioning protein
MPPRKRGFFAEPSRPEDELARQQEVEALLAPRRTVVQDLAIARIRPNPYQARKEFTGLEELAEAIRQQGFVSRLRVRQDPGAPGYFQLVYGERRLRAAALAGLEAVPVEIAEHSDAELIEIGLAENIQRRDLAPLEEADAFQRLIREQGYSVRRLAERIGKDKSYVENRLKLLEAPADVRQMVERRPDTLRAAREIAKVEDAGSRAALIQGVVEGSLSTEGVRGAVKGRTGTRAEDALGVARRQVAGDVQAVLAIVRRWGALLDESDEAHALVEPALGEVVVALEHIAERLKSRRS